MRYWAKVIVVTILFGLSIAGGVYDGLNPNVAGEPHSERP